MTATLRNIGFSRNNHQNSLHALSTEYKNTQKYYDDLASFTSFKASGIAPKIIAFLGGGTTGGLTSLVTEFSTKIFPEQDAESIDALNATIQTITDPEVVEQANNQLSNIVQSTTQFPALEIIIFLISGAFALAFVNIFFICYKRGKLKKEKARIVCEQRKYYIKKYRRNMALMLFNFYNDIEKLARKFYRRDYQEDFNKVDFSGIVIEEDEFNWLYKDTKFSQLWKPEEVEKRTYTADHDDKRCLEEQDKTHPAYDDNRRKNYVNTYRLDIEESTRYAYKLWYFITYKILPPWFTAQDPEQQIASSNAKA